MPTIAIIMWWLNGHVFGTLRVGPGRAVNRSVPTGSTHNMRVCLFIIYSSEPANMAHPPPQPPPPPHTHPTTTNCVGRRHARTRDCVRHDELLLFYYFFFGGGEAEARAQSIISDAHAQSFTYRTGTTLKPTSRASQHNADFPQFHRCKHQLHT